MEKILTSKLIEELKLIDSRIECVPNPNRPGLSNIKLNGVDICPVPSEMMQTEHTPDYVYVFPNGMAGKMKTYDEAKSMTLSVLNNLKNSEYANDFFAKDE